MRSSASTNWPRASRTHWYPDGVPLPPVAAQLRVKHLPNILSLARILVAPYLFVLLWRREYGLALVVMFLTGISDGLDGFLARRLNAHSKVGAMLDPIGDKVLLSGSFLILGLDRAIPGWLMWLVLGRDA